MRIVAAGLLSLMVPALVSAQGFAGIFEKAPPNIDAALRARIQQFFVAQKAQNWAQALQIVHPESQNAFIGADKMRYNSFKIIAINWDENYTSAKAVIEFETEFHFPGFGKRDVHIPLTSVWKLIDGQWYWYAVPFNPQQGKDSPFGPMFRDPAGKPVAGPGEAPDINKLIASGPSIAELRSRVTVDKSEVILQSHIASEDTIKVVSKFDGAVHVKVDADELPCLSTSIDKPVLQAGETATIKFACKPDNPVKKPDGRATVTIEEIAKVMPVKITFAYPPADAAASKSNK